MFTPKPIVAALAAISFIGTANAAEEVTELEEVIVTASRTAQTVDEALAPVTVISRKDIERSQATSVTELLSKTPGVQIGTYGGAGSTASIYLRGTTSAQTLVLVDGVRVNSVTGGAAEIQFLSPDSIEKIEIVRGPRSSLYGSDALGGVIQIFTRKGNGKPHLTVKAGTGSRNTNDLGISYGGEVDGTRFYLGADLYETGGYDFTNDNGTANFGANLDDDAYRNKSIAGSISHTLSSGVIFGGSFTRSEGKGEYDASTYNSGYYPYYAYSEFRNTQVNTFVSAPVNETWTPRLDLGYTENRNSYRGKGDSEKAPYSPSENKTQRFSAMLQNDIFWSESQLLTVGLDYYDDHVDATKPYVNPETDKVEDSRYNAAVFIQNQSSFDSSDLQIGLRADKNEAFGSHTTGNLAWGIDLPEDMRLIASYGTSFRAPTFNDLYYPDTGSSVGNPNLKPEESKNIELELKGDHTLAQWSVSLFQNSVDNMINWQSVNGKSRPENIDKARIRGVELTLEKSIADWNVGANITALNPENRSGPDKGNVLIYRAEQLFTLNLDRQFNRLGLGATLNAQGKSYKDTTNKTEVAGFGTLDLRMSIDISPELKANLKVVNLFDKEYQAVYGYRGEPKGAFLTFIWTPEL